MKVLIYYDMTLVTGEIPVPVESKQYRITLAILL